MKIFKLLLTVLTVIIISILILYKYFNSNKNIPVIKTIAFIVHTETIGGKGVYDIYKEMKKIGHNVKIIAIPYLIDKELLYDIDLNFTSKFNPNDVIYPCGITPPFKKCDFAITDKFDFIFTQNPYNTYKNSILDTLFSTTNLHNIANSVMYIVYGPHIFHQNTLNDEKLKNTVDKVFVDSESTKQIYIERYKFPESRVIVSGYQPYKSIRLKARKDNIKETILWLPRWTLSFKNRDLFEGGSTFLNYHYFFYNYALANPDKHLIIRPHQLFFTDSVINNHLSQHDLDEIFNKYRKLKNVTVSFHKSVPLTDDILNADIIISDGSSALAEGVVADKPIIYLSNGWNNEFDSNELSKKLKNYVQIAYDPNDIIKYINSIRKNNYKPLLKDQKRIKFRALIDPVENPDEFIANYLLYNSI